MGAALWDSGATWDSGIVWDGGPSGGISPMIRFFDETGVNPLPAGIKVSLYTPIQTAPPSQPQGADTNVAYPGGGGARGIINPSQPYNAGVIGPDLSTSVLLQNTQAFVNEAWTWPMGFCAIPTITGQTYTAAFSTSFQAPGQPQTFTAALVSGTNTIVNVQGYRSPSFSNMGYALEQTKRLVQGWFNSTARQPGGVAYSIAYAYGAALYALDQQTQNNLGSIRLQSSQGDEIDSWGLDFVGPIFQRFPGEADAEYITRLILMVSRPRTTINAIQALVEAFYRSIADEYALLKGGLGYQIAGSYDVDGGYNRGPTGGPPTPPPPIYVWDRMTEPVYANIFGIDHPEFVIQIGNFTQSLQEALAYAVVGSYDTTGGYNIFPTGDQLPPISFVAPDPRLGQMINLIAKGGGTVPVYLVGS